MRSRSSAKQEENKLVYVYYSQKAPFDNIYEREHRRQRVAVLAAASTLGLGLMIQPQCQTRQAWKKVYLPQSKKNPGFLSKKFELVAYLKRLFLIQPLVVKIVKSKKNVCLGSSCMIPSKTQLFFEILQPHRSTHKNIKKH